MVSFLRSIKTKVNSAFMRITLTRVSALFFLFSFVHCFAQGILQASIFIAEEEFSTITSNILKAADIPNRDISWLAGPGNGNYHLQICTDIPLKAPPYPFCETVFQTGQGPFNVTAGYRREEEAIVISDALMSVTPVSNAQGSVVGVQMGSSTFNLQCSRVIIYLDTMLLDTKRESIVLIFLQFWLFIISFIAIAYDSIPHTISVLLARAIILCWSCFSLRREWFHEDEYNTMITGPESPCGSDLYPGYFARRFALELPDLLLNCTAFLISLYLSIRLLKTYREQQFTSIGAPPVIVKIYKWFMATMACLQLSVFVLLTAMILWANQLMSTNAANISKHTKPELFVICFTTALVIPWLSMGWYAITREHKVWMGIYLGLGLVFVGGWAGMLDSEVYRFTLAQWSFLATTTALSFLVLICSLVFGTICFRNFGQGFSSYLHAVDALAQSDFVPEVFSKDIEKGSMDKSLDFGDEDTKYYAPTLHSGPTHSPTPIHSGGAYEQA